MATSRPRGTASINQRMLLRAAKNDNHRALEELMRRYEPLIGAIVARLHLPGGCEPADLAQEARIGLLCAIRAWQPARGPFPAFAALCARNQALGALDAAGARKHQFLNHARSLDDHDPRTKAPLKLLNGHAPRETHEPAETQLNTPLGEQFVASSADADPLHTVIAREELRAVLAAMPTLTPAEGLVVAGTVNDKSQRQIAAELGWSRKTVIRVQRSAREKLAAQPPLAA